VEVEEDEEEEDAVPADDVPEAEEEAEVMDDVDIDVIELAFGPLGCS